MIPAVRISLEDGNGLKAVLTMRYGDEKSLFGVGDVPVVSADTHIGPDGRPVIAFPNGHPSCFVCGTCKRARVRAHQAAGRAAALAVILAPVARIHKRDRINSISRRSPGSSWPPDDHRQ